MMADLAEASRAARSLFAQADDQLGFSLSELCFTGPADRLNATDMSQPAMFVASGAALQCDPGSSDANDCVVVNVCVKSRIYDNADAVNLRSGL